ncbi:unnamed protein product [Clonostachys rosea f. rosea IK726]|uniref:Uncharacterized protein n=1 Tax=Clonostachys rosea f. rosea IK726 TaxID=1349383 RepID=A0ACA9ULE4_BIOOC|nr:unnamed protein product [Clonostachys rosea f. rosea IK726]
MPEGSRTTSALHTQGTGPCRQPRAWGLDATLLRRNKCVYSSLFGLWGPLDWGLTGTFYQRQCDMKI